MSRDLTLHIPKSMKLADNAQWQHRFHIRSSSSNRLYVIAQNKKGRYWACSCLGWITRRNCLHLHELALPGSCKPHEPVLGAGE